MKTAEQARRAWALALAAVLAGLSWPSCGGDGRSPERVETLDYRPAARGDGWRVSTPEAHGLDPSRIRSCYQSAAALENIYSLLIVRDGELLGEAYFNGSRVDAATPSASVTKSITSALVGLALREGRLASLEQRLHEFFPEIDWRSPDPRKAMITLRQVLQMRSGYPWEERDGYLAALFSQPSWIPRLGDFPLLGDPGTRFGYSNLTAHVMGIVVARATGQSLHEFAQSHLFGPVGMEVRGWPIDADGYYFGSGDAAFPPRSMAKFGQLYLDDGLWNGAAVLPPGWVEQSLEAYSHNVYGSEILDSIRGLGYGYLWWSASCGSRRVDFAWGHGGQLIFVVRELDMVIVATARHLGLQFGQEAWRLERGVMEVVGNCIASL